MHMYIYVFIYVYIYICIYICIHIYTWPAERSVDDFDRGDTDRRWNAGEVGSFQGECAACDALCTDAVSAAL